MAIEQHDAIVVGGGFAGLAAARELQLRGLKTVVLERTEAVGSSWRSRPDQLRLNTWRVVSRLPGSCIPRKAGPWPRRDDLVALLERYVRVERITVQTGIEAQRVDRMDGVWRVVTSKGPVKADVVVVATGHDRVPVMPNWPGCERYLGELTHSSAYRSAVPYRERDVLVVGVGNSGAEIATDLASNGALRVRLAVRGGVNLFGPRFLGVPITVWALALRHVPNRAADLVSTWTQHWRYSDLERLGVVPAPWGMATEMRIRGKGPVLDRGFSDAIRAGRIEVVGAVAGFDGPDVVLASGVRIRPEAVIAATGYRAGLESLVGHVVKLDNSGRPMCRETGANPDCPGLYFVGYALPLSGQLPEMASTAERIGRLAAQYAKSKAVQRSESRPRPVKWCTTLTTSSSDQLAAASLRDEGARCPGHSGQDRAEQQ